MLRRLIAAMTVLTTLLCLMINTALANSRFTKDDTWLIYMYICGADLESNGHVSTRNIAEMEKVKLPPNIKVLIGAGGSLAWHHPTIKAGGDGIYLYSADRLEKKVDWNANMGSPDTLANFLRYGEKNFNADHRIIIFRDHGGLNGVCYDYKFGKYLKDDSGRFVLRNGTPVLTELPPHLTYDDLNNVFAAVYGNSPENPPFELTGFGACMTGSYELANSISKFSHYMLGSECSEYGWYFTPWIEALANDPSMDGAQIGKVICDSVLNSYDDITKLTNTFSVIDLTKMPELREAYEEYFAEALKRANEEAGFSGAFARAASARNVDKYSNLYTDLGLLAKNTKQIMPKESKKLLKAIDKAVVYNKHGSYLKSRGISTYYPYVSSESPVIREDDFNNFLRQKSTSNDQKNLYRRLLGLNVADLQGAPVKLNSEDHFVVKLTPEQMENVSMIQCLLVPVVENGDPDFGLEDEGGVLSLSADDLKIDWKKGTVTENFRGVQPVFDGHKIAMFASVKSRGHNFYEVPILLNVPDINDLKNIHKYAYTLQVRYDLSKKKYEIIGIGSMVENGMVRSVNYKLKPGDVITPIFMGIVPESSADVVGTAYKYTDPKTGRTIFIGPKFGKSFVYTRDSAITDKKILRGNYGYAFHFIAPNGTAVVSQPAAITIEYGEIDRWDSEDLQDIDDD